MRVGMVLPIYNQTSGYIEECIGSIEAQVFRDFKVIIVIDGANQQTVNTIYNTAPRLTVPYKVIHRKENKGIAYSLNEGFSHLQDCEYFTWISSDNRYSPHFLKVLVDKIDSSPPNVVLVYSLFNLIGKYGQELYIKDSFEKKLLKKMSQHKNVIMQLNFIGASFLYRRNSYNQVGGYDPNYEKVEDYEFWQRLLQIGEISLIPDFLMDYRLDGDFAYTTLTSDEEIDLRGAEASILNRKRIKDIPKVSIILSNRNNRTFIRRTINSILNQSLANFHLILIDDASTDESWNVMNNFYDSRIIPIRLTKARGTAEILRIGLKYSIGEYILRLDGNTWLEPNALEILVYKMDHLPQNIAFIHANHTNWIQRGKSLIEGSLVKGAHYKNKYHFLREYRPSSIPLYRKSALEHLNRWPTRIDGKKILITDYTVMLRLSDHYKCYWVDKNIYHRRTIETRRQIHLLKQQQYQTMREIQSALKRWGNKYKPIFIKKKGWVKKVKLRERNPKNKNFTKKR